MVLTLIQWCGSFEYIASDLKSNFKTSKYANNQEYSHCLRQVPQLTNLKCWPQSTNLSKMLTSIKHFNKSKILASIKLTNLKCWPTIKS